jgi:glutamate dehydrogenase (NAD(P)+)
MLHQQGISILPDILVNAGGVMVSYFEWVQNNENEHWPLELVNQKLEKRMNYAVDAVVAKKCYLEETADAEASKAGYIDYHTAAMVVALERLLLTITARGIWP